MSELMEQAIEKLRQLPEDKQESFAKFLMWELEEDRRWEETTEKYADKLEEFVEQIRQQGRRGEFEELDPGRL